MSNETSTSSGVGFCGLLAIAFIVLKLTNYIDWSWVWVLAPLWIPLAIWAAVIVIVYLYIGIVNLLTPASEKKRLKDLMKRKEERERMGQSKFQQRLNEMAKERGIKLPDNS